MSSTIFFRLHHGKQSEQITFEGNGLRLIELKKAIVEKKAMTGSLDFDLKVTDENDPEKGVLFILVEIELFSMTL